MVALRQGRDLRRRPRWSLAVVAAGCSVVNKVKPTVHDVEGNKATIDSFTQNL